MKKKRLGLAKLVEHAVDKSQEYAGVHAHRAGGIEQHHQPQRLFLAPPLDETDRHAAMADIAVDGPSQVEPVAAPPRQIAAGQPRAHGFCQPRRHFVGLLDLGWGRPSCGNRSRQGFRRARRLPCGPRRRAPRRASSAEGTWSVAASPPAVETVVLQAFQRRAAGGLRRTRWSSSATVRACRARTRRTAHRTCPSRICAPRTDA